MIKGLRRQGATGSPSIVSFCKDGGRIWSKTYSPGRKSLHFLHPAANYIKCSLRKL